MTRSTVPKTAPSAALYLTEHARSLATFGCLVAGQPWITTAPRVDGRPVVVLPGLAAGDLSTAPIRGYLRGLGYDVSGWGLGINIGPTRRVLRDLKPMIENVAQRTGSEVALVGWSLGGIFARMVAREIPETVSQVVTLGSPFRFDSAHQARTENFFNKLSRFHAPQDEWPERDTTLGGLPVPATSIYSRLDGIVDWRACIDVVDDRHENIQVWSSHLGFGHDPAVMWAVADRLAQPPGTWKPFQAPWYAHLAYPPATTLSN